jgi:kumamolisin
MEFPASDKAIKDSEHIHPEGHRVLRKTSDDSLVTVTLILRRRPGGPELRKAEEASAESRPLHKRLSRSEFADAYGADPNELEEVSQFARSHGLEVLESHAARRSLVVRGTAAAINKAFAVELHDYESPLGPYRSHTGSAHVPAALADKIEAVIGLDNRPVPAKHYSTARRQNPNDPPNTKPLTPQEVAKLYNFPAGLGTGQTIGIYEMQTQEGAAGYTMQDLTDTMRAFGGNLKLPTISDVPIDGVKNSGVSDGETGLDITVAGAVAQGAQIAVYFTGGNSQNILHAVQRMVHPDPGDPEPTILSISYGWGPDDGPSQGLPKQMMTQLSGLFQDAASLAITVLVSSGDSGAFIASKTQAETSYPASDPWVTACGGSTIGNIVGTTFDEYVWNDTGQAGPGATGGGVSAHFPVPGYQQQVKIPRRHGSNKAGRGVPDIAGNASENSGYPQFINGRSGPVGGTSAVAPLYAGLVALINANLGSPVGFLNPVLYAAGAGVFRDISSPPGPANNSFSGVTGYQAVSGWNPCTGLGSVDGVALEAALKASLQNPAEPTHDAAAPIVPPSQVFQSGTFRGLPLSDAFAAGASQTEPVIINLGQVPWPAGLAPRQVQLGNYDAGQEITGPLKVKADALVVFFTEYETMALLDVFTKNNSWNESRQRTWCGYGHNFANYAPIPGAGEDTALKEGMFGYLAAVQIGTKIAVLYKSELHPKQNGSKLPFVGVMQQLIQELEPALVIGTGTAGAIGGNLNCGDVAITSRARFHVRDRYPTYADINTMSNNQAELKNLVTLSWKYVQYAAANFTKLSLDGLAQCYTKLQALPGYSFVHKNQQAPSIYVTDVNPVPGPQPMDIVSADYLTVDDKFDSEGLQSLGVMNDTDDAFLFYAISQIAGQKPMLLSVRNASEPQIVVPAFPPGTSQQAIVKKLSGVAGSIYGIYQYCTTLNSAFACWGVIAGM